MLIKGGANYACKDLDTMPFPRMSNLLALDPGAAYVAFIQTRSAHRRTIGLTRSSLSAVAPTPPFPCSFPHPPTHPPTPSRTPHTSLGRSVAPSPPSLPRSSPHPPTHSITLSRAPRSSLGHSIAPVAPCGRSCSLADEQIAGDLHQLLAGILGLGLILNSSTDFSPSLPPHTREP